MTEDLSFTSREIISSALRSSRIELISSFNISAEVPGNDPRPASFNRDKNCLYLNTAEQGSLTQRSLARKLFFQIGKYLSKFHDKLQKFELPKNHFPHTVSDEPAFVSSNYDMPYPMAAVEEYEQIMKKVCANDQRRLTYLEKSYRKNGNRQPASEGFVAEQKKLLRRCKHFL